MQIPLINEHLFCKYFVRLSVGNASIKGFATYGCFHPCLSYKLLTQSEVKAKLEAIPILKWTAVEPLKNL